MKIQSRKIKNFVKISLGRLFLVRVCAWCGVKVGLRSTVLGTFMPQKNYSHGIFKRCQEEQFEAFIK